VTPAPSAAGDLIEAFPRRALTVDNAAFHAAWLNHELALNRCAACATWHHPPRSMCPRCWSDDVVATPVSGRGTVHLLIGLHRGESAPVPVVTVELVEQRGLRFTSRLLDCEYPAAAIGLAVELRWIERDGAPFPVFVPRRGE
jgi:uncharacterized OB-fold protein